MLSFGDIPAELYRWFLLAYGVTAAGRIAAEVYKQIAVLGTAWYDVPTPVLNLLEQGFIQHALLSLALAEGINMVLGALFKDKVRRQTREERDRAWREWLRRKAETEANGETFDEPSPDEQPEEPRRRFLSYRR
jgi:hypothetical protein